MNTDVSRTAQESLHALELSGAADRGQEHEQEQEGEGELGQTEISKSLLSIQCLIV